MSILATYSPGLNGQVFGEKLLPAATVQTVLSQNRPRWRCRWHLSEKTDTDGTCVNKQLPVATLRYAGENTYNQKTNHLPNIIKKALLKEITDSLHQCLSRAECTFIHITISPQLNITYIPCFHSLSRNQKSLANCESVKVLSEGSTVLWRICANSHLHGAIIFLYKMSFWLAFIAHSELVLKSLGRFSVITRLPITLKAFCQHDDQLRGTLQASAFYIVVKYEWQIAYTGTFLAHSDLYMSVGGFMVVYKIPDI